MSVLAMLRRASTAVEPGARFRAAGTNSFGNPKTTVWEVERVLTPLHGSPHARIRNRGDRTEMKSVALSVLTDRAYYLPEA